MRRLMFPLLIAFTALGCNLSDNVTFPDPGDNAKQNNNTGEPDVGPDTSEPDTSEPTPLSFEVTEATLSGEELPATFEAASGDLDAEASFAVTNSGECADCNVQLLFAFDAQTPVCLYDGPAGEELTGSATIAALGAAGETQLHAHVVEAADCDAAIALGTIEASDPIGTVTFTPERLRVASVDPTDGAINILDNRTVRVGFSGPIDEASVGDLVRLEQDGTVVATTLTTDANGVTLTPTAPLTEFETEYTVVVEPGITGGDRELVDGFTSTFSTRMFLPGLPYAIISQQYPGYALGFANLTNAASLRSYSTEDSLVHFTFISGGDGWVGRPTINQALTATDDEPPTLTVTPQTSLEPQIWHFIPQGNGSFWLRNEAAGDDLSLDSGDVDPATTVVTVTLQPTLVDEANEEQQDWSLIRVERTP